MFKIMQMFTRYLHSCLFIILLMRTALLSSGFLSKRKLAFATLQANTKLDDLMGEILSQQTTRNSSIAKTDQTIDDWISIHWVDDIDPLPPSPVQEVIVADRLVYLKRDDILRLDGSQISGNKARKLMALTQLDDFPSCIVSYGGPQSNAMLAIAAIVHFKNEHLDTEDPRRKRFVYCTKTLPQYLRDSPRGNLFRAVTLGMELQEFSLAEYNNLFGGDYGGSLLPPHDLPPPVPKHSLWIPQGGACGVARPGTKLLAEEIWAFWKENGSDRPLSVYVPGGTCTTAFMLHCRLQELLCTTNGKKLDIEVVVVPCVGDAGYARRQMLFLASDASTTTPPSLPAVLPPFPETYFGQPSKGHTRYFPFGEPDSKILEVFQKMRKDFGITLDLLYGSSAWAVLLRHWRSLAREREIMYVHSGGLEGINSQLLRYKYKGLIDEEEVQYP